MKRYTDEDVRRLVDVAEDVKRLVKVAKDVERVIGKGYRPAANCGYHRDLQDALKPFLPDPEDELISEMREAYGKVIGKAGHPDRGMRAILDLLKDRELLKELT